MFLQETRKKPKSCNMHSREFSMLIWPQSNNLQTKLIQSSFTKIARNCFGCQLWWFGFVWTKNFALQLWLFPQHQIFFEQSCVTRAFILSQTTSEKHHERFICGTVNNIKGWFVEQDLLLVSWLHVLSVTNKSCLPVRTHEHLFFFDKSARAFFVFQHKNFFQLDRTPKRTDFSLARVFLFFHRFCETHATLQTLQCFVIVCVAHNTLAHIYVQNILACALATCGNSLTF